MIISYYHYGKESSNSEIFLRKFPYPYRSGLAISSDIDETDSLKEFLAIQEFLITNNDTPFGKGLGLEIGNSFFGYVESNQFAFKSKRLLCQIDKMIIIELINTGYIDFIHSFNNAAKKEILKILNELKNNGCKLNVWVNHADAKSNLGIHPGRLGDNFDSNYYHTDISLGSLGYNFIWVQDITSVVGQGRPVNPLIFLDAFNKKYYFQSFYNNVFKEIVKFGLSPISRKYRPRLTNDLIWPHKLDDGQMVFAFVRSNVHPKGLKNASSKDLSDCLTPNILNSLIENEGYMIIYTHLGKNNDGPWISNKTIEALRRLEKAFSEGIIYITTTAKLLKYYANRKYLNYHVITKNGEQKIIIEGISDPVRGEYIPDVEDLMGITFFIDNPENANIYIKDQLISDVKRNYPVSNERKSIMINLKWLPKMDKKFLEYREQGYFP
jgi:hypothetical protein